MVARRGLAPAVLQSPIRGPRRLETLQRLGPTQQAVLLADLFRWPRLRTVAAGASAAAVTAVPKRNLRGVAS